MQEILGHINDPGVDILSIVRAYGLPEEFPEDVMEEVPMRRRNSPQTMWRRRSGRTEEWISEMSRW